jgi:hypothetical protein
MKQLSSFHDVQLHIVDAPLAAGPESILPIMVNGFLCRCATASPATVQRPFISTQRNSAHSLIMHEGGDIMERRHFLKLAFGVAAGATALAAGAHAAPLPPIAAEQGLVPRRGEGAQPAVVAQDAVDRLKPEEVHWRHHWHRRHWGWHRRHWGWHRRWHRRHW